MPVDLTVLDALPSTAETIRAHGLLANKKLGQHFLTNPDITDRIAALGGNLSHASVMEVGPGPGGLTRSILRMNPKEFILIEKDERAEELLSPLKQAMPSLELQLRDALQAPLWEMGSHPRWIISNLPYNISTVLLTNWLHHADALEGMILMFQKEVADRIIAAPGSKAFGRLSVLSQYLCHISHGMTLPAGAFTPPPKIDSSVLLFRPKPAAMLPVPAKAIEKVAQAAFGQRRKMLRQSLKSVHPSPEDWCNSCNIAPTLRAEQLTIDDFIKLARYLA